MTLYFAYGSNMDRAGMRQRCPGATALGVARLDGWRILVFSAGYVSVAAEQETCVHGVLWRLGPRDLAALDEYEAVAAGLYRRQALPVLADGGVASAEVYIGRDAKPARVRPAHLATVLAAARNWQLPAAYLEELQRLASVPERRDPS